MSIVGSLDRWIVGSQIVCINKDGIFRHTNLLSFQEAFQESGQADRQQATESSAKSEMDNAVGHELLCSMARSNTKDAVVLW